VKKSYDNIIDGTSFTDIENLKLNMQEVYVRVTIVVVEKQ